MSAEQPDASERGSLRIAAQVVRKVAELAADRVEGTTIAPRRIAGVGVGHRGSHIKVSQRAEIVDLAVDLALHYPAPIRTIVDDVRSGVIADVERMTAHRVGSLDVTVSALLPETTARVD